MRRGGCVREYFIHPGPPPVFLEFPPRFPVGEPARPVLAVGHDEGSCEEAHVVWELAGAEGFALLFLLEEGH